MPIDAGGTFTRLYNFEQDRDAGIRILASRMDAELNNIADALNTPVPSQSVTYQGEELSTVFDRVFSQLGARVPADDIAYGTTTVAGELGALRGLIDTNNFSLSNRIATQETRQYAASEISYDGTTVAATLLAIQNELDQLPLNEGYWSNGTNIISEGTWAPSAGILSEGVWTP